jgi:hypothetical protein
MSGRLKRTWHARRWLALILVSASAILPRQAFAQAASTNPTNLSCSLPVTVGIAPAGTADSPGRLAERIVVEPAQIEARLFSSDGTSTLTLRNESSSPVSEIYVSVRDLGDGKTGRKYGPFRWAAKLNPALQTNQQTDCTFHLPVLTYAGAYTGIMRVVGGEREMPVPITLRTRGPILCSWYWLPLTLAIVTVLLGWGLSLILDQWYTKGLPRVQAVLLLREQRAAIANFSSRLAQWETTNHVSARDAELAAAFDVSEVDTALKQAGNFLINDLQQLSIRFAVVTRLNDEIWTAFQIAVLKVPPTNLAQTVARLDAVPRSVDPVAYRASLLQVLTTPPPVAAAAVAAAIPASLQGIDLSGVSSASLRHRIATMDFVKWLVLALVVLFTAYTVYYLPNPAFGTLQDYLALLIWSLGLSTTGSQLVSSIHK